MHVCSEYVHVYKYSCIDVCVQSRVPQIHFNLTIGIGKILIPTDRLSTNIALPALGFISLSMSGGTSGLADESGEIILSVRSRLDADANLRKLFRFYE